MVYQTLWSRVAARIIDSVLLTPLFLLEIRYNPSPVWLLVIILIVDHAYFIIGHAQYGQTLGKKLLGVKVVRAHEHLPIGWSHALIREGLWIVVNVLVYASTGTAFEVYGLSLGILLVLSDFVLACIHPHHRSLRDFMAKTVVIRVD